VGEVGRWIATAIAGASGLCWALSMGYKSERLRSSSLPDLATVEVDQGDMTLVVTENGSLESLDDDVARCRVESFLALPVGAPAARWVGDRTFAAIAMSTTTGTDWIWRPIALGMTDATFAEVVSGLEPGDRVIADSTSLPPAELGTHDPETLIDLALEGRHSSELMR
jgi:hypothetical protein